MGRVVAAVRGEGKGRVAREVEVESGEGFPLCYCMHLWFDCKMRVKKKGANTQSRWCIFAAINFPLLVEEEFRLLCDCVLGYVKKEKEKIKKKRNCHC